MHDARGHAAPEGIYIGQSMSARVITNMLHFQHSKNLTASLPVYQLLYIVTGMRCDCGPIFRCCYDVHAYNGSDCGFSFIKF